MSGQLPTLLLVGVFIGGGIVLLNPELRCNLLGLCGGGSSGGSGSQTPPADEPETPPPPPEEEENDDDGNITNIYNVTTNPQPVILNPPPPTYYPTSRGPQIVRYASNRCCECKTHSDGIVRCRTHPHGNYTISYRSAKYNVVESARLCAKNKCGSGGIFGGIFGGGSGGGRDDDRDHDRGGGGGGPRPSRCATQISKNGRRYSLTNLTRLPSVMTMQYPPTYVKEGNCIYQILNSPTPTPRPPYDGNGHGGGGPPPGHGGGPPPPPGGPPPPTGGPPNPPPTSSKCTDYLCKSYPWLCPQCPQAAARYSQSLFTTSRIAI